VALRSRSQRIWISERQANCAARSCAGPWSEEFRRLALTHMRVTWSVAVAIAPAMHSPELLAVRAQHRALNSELAHTASDPEPEPGFRGTSTSAKCQTQITPSPQKPKAESKSKKSKSSSNFISNQQRGGGRGSIHAGTNTRGRQATSTGQGRA
jgi:hypothetical protein